MKKLARLVLIGLALEMIGWYGAKWYVNGSADPRCAFVRGWIAVHYLSAAGDKIQCERDEELSSQSRDSP
jgi:hypothetical protein